VDVDETGREQQNIASITRVAVLSRRLPTSVIEPLLVATLPMNAAAPVPSTMRAPVMTMSSMSVLPGRWPARTLALVARAVQ